MTFNDLVERTKRLLNAGKDAPHIWPDNEIEIAATVNDAIQQMSVNVMHDAELRPWLQQNYTITLGATGESTNLLTATGSITSQTAEIILEGIRYGVVQDIDGNVLVPILQYAEFLKPQATVFGYYTLKDQVIATRAIGVAVNGPPDIQSANGPLTVTASFAPKNVTDVPRQLEDDLVEMLANLLTSR